MEPLSGLRILVCGKGGSGKSSLTAVMAGVLERRGYAVVLVDGDASNPGGLTRLVLGAVRGPDPLIEFFGGREKVVCPVDDPAPLTRVSDAVPVVERHVDLTEIPERFYVRRGGVLLFQVGKIHRAYEGCDGPMSKVSRDFILTGDAVTLIDVEAGIEHFGRGVEKNADVVLIIVDPTFESLEIAARVTGLTRSMGITSTLALINGVDSQATEDRLRRALEARNVDVLGCVSYDPKVREAGMLGTAVGPCRVADEIAVIMERLEQVVSFPGAPHARGMRRTSAGAGG